MISCQVCGCTNERACPGGCSLVSVDPPICSACIDEAADDGCPNTASGFHYPLFRADGSAYCASCRQELEFPREEAA